MKDHKINLNYSFLHFFPLHHKKKTKNLITYYFHKLFWDSIKLESRTKRNYTYCYTIYLKRKKEKKVFCHVNNIAVSCNENVQCAAYNRKNANGKYPWLKLIYERVFKFLTLLDKEDKNRAGNTALHWHAGTIYEIAPILLDIQLFSRHSITNDCNVCTYVELVTICATFLKKNWKRVFIYPTTEEWFRKRLWNVLKNSFSLKRYISFKKNIRLSFLVLILFSFLNIE